MTGDKCNRWAFWAFFAAVTACFVFIYVVFPPTYDEWGFMSAFMEYDTDAGGHHSLWMGIKHQLFSYNRSDPPRIGNTIGPLMLLAPRWISAVASGLAVGLSILMMAYLAGVRQGQIFKMIALSFLMVFGINWQDHMFCLLYAWNYVMTTIIFLAAIYFFLRKKPIKCWAGMLLGVILGLWHESFGLSFAIGAAVAVNFHRSLFEKWRLWIVGGSCVGLAIYFSFPSIWARTSTIIHVREGVSALLSLYVWYAAMIGVIVCAFSRKWRYIVKSPLTVFTIVSGVIAIPLVLRTSFVRIGFPAMILSIILLLRLADLWWPRLMEMKRRWSAVLAAVMAAAVIIHLVAVCYVAVQYHRANQEMTADAWANYRDHTSIFTSVIYPWETTPLALTRPDKEMFITGKNHIVYVRYFYMNLRMTFVPKELRDYRAGEGVSLNDTTAHRLWKGYIVSPELSDTLRPWATIRYEHYDDKSPLHHAVFVGADGHEYVYTQPIRSVVGRYMGEPKEIVFNLHF